MAETTVGRREEDFRRDHVIGERLLFLFKVIRVSRNIFIVIRERLLFTIITKTHRCHRHCHGCYCSHPFTSSDFAAYSSVPRQRPTFALLVIVLLLSTTNLLSTAITFGKINFLSAIGFHC